MNIIYQYQSNARQLQAKAFAHYDNGDDQKGDECASKAQSLYIHASNMLEALQESGTKAAMIYHVLNMR
jgi:hypothetical protein